MPIFDFRCGDCGHVFDELVKSADATGAVACAKCGSKRVERLVSAFAAAGRRAGETRAVAPGASRRGGCGPGCGCGAR
jgi:putative FmdB family regulatory protein